MLHNDIGRSLNPTLVRGQVEGSVYMGLGEAVMEEQAFRRLPAKLSHALVHKFPSILEYKSPTTHDMCDVVTEQFVLSFSTGRFPLPKCGYAFLVLRICT